MEATFDVPALHAIEARSVTAVHEAGHAVVGALHGLEIVYVSSRAGQPITAFQRPDDDALIEEEWCARSRAALGGPLAEAAFVRGHLADDSWRCASEGDIDVAFACIDLLHENDPAGATAELSRAISETEKLLERGDVWAAVSDLSLMLDERRTLLDSDVRAVLRGVQL